jgi:hypothetical protein
MRALATGLLTFLILIQSSMSHAQGWNSAVTPLHPGKHRHNCPGAGYYDNVQTCCCVNNFTGNYCLRQSGGQSCNLACRNSILCS